MKNFKVENTISVIVVKSCGEIIETKMKNLKDFEQVIEGKVRKIPMGNYGLCFAHHSAFWLFPVNELATVVYKNTASSPNLIYGDVVFLGYADEFGNYTSIPEMLVDLIKKISSNVSWQTKICVKWNKKNKKLIK